MQKISRCVRVYRRSVTERTVVSNSMLLLGLGSQLKFIVRSTIAEDVLLIE